jgi:two-component system, OmpR family, response regulator
MHVLVVEDETKMANLLARGLAEEGHVVDVADPGDDARWMAQAAEYDTIIIDLAPPGPDGFEACRELREQNVSTPVLILTARDPIDAGGPVLGSSADDYLVKPFSFAELLGRLGSLHERPSRA